MYKIDIGVIFFLLPLSYYILEYTLTVYTDLLYTGGPVIIDFMDSFLVLFFFILAMVSLDFSNKKSTDSSVSAFLFKF